MIEIMLSVISANKFKEHSFGINAEMKKGNDLKKRIRCENNGLTDNGTIERRPWVNYSVLSFLTDVAHLPMEVTPGPGFFGWPCGAIGL